VVHSHLILTFFDFNKSHCLYQISITALHSDRLCHYTRSISKKWIFGFRISARQSYVFSIYIILGMFKISSINFMELGVLRIDLQSGYYPEDNIQNSLLSVLLYLFATSFIRFSLFAIFWSTFRVTKNMQNIYNLITDSSSGIISYPTK